MLWALPRGAHRGVRPVHRGEYRSLHDGALRPSAKRDLSPPDPGGKGLNKRGPKGFASSPCHSHPFPSSTPHLSAHAFATKLPDSPSSGQPSLTQGPRCSCEPSALSAPGRVAWACPGPGLGFIHLIPSVAHDWASWTQAPGRDTEKPLRSTLGQSWFQLHAFGRPGAHPSREGHSPFLSENSASERGGAGRVGPVPTRGHAVINDAPQRLSRQPRVAAVECRVSRFPSRPAPRGAPGLPVQKKCPCFQFPSIWPRSHSGEGRGLVLRSDPPTEDAEQTPGPGHLDLIPVLSCARAVGF